MRIGTTLLLGIAFAGVPCVVGCEKEVYRETEVDVDDDGTTKKQTTVTEEPDGSLRKTESETKTKP